mmetsp:Transcript_20294/g.46845  ORF Transcript_20294/g.46845 Transcript_20294/m.46845 type:complete len:282 (-) Transcript_20294:175-1020(-)
MSWYLRLEETPRKLPHWIEFSSTEAMWSVGMPRASISALVVEWPTAEVANPMHQKVKALYTKQAALWDGVNPPFWRKKPGRLATDLPRPEGGGRRAAVGARKKTRPKSPRSSSAMSEATKSISFQKAPLLDLSTTSASIFVIPPTINSIESVTKNRSFATSRDIIGRDRPPIHLRKRLSCTFTKFATSPAPIRPASTASLISLDSALPPNTAATSSGSPNLSPPPPSSSPLPSFHPLPFTLPPPLPPPPVRVGRRTVGGVPSEGRTRLLRAPEGGSLATRA